MNEEIQFELWRIATAMERQNELYAEVVDIQKRMVENSERQAERWIAEQPAAKILNAVRNAVR